MNAFKKIKWFFANRIYPSSDMIGYLVGSFIDEGKLIKENDFYAFIEYKDNIYKVWIENYPYAWLSKCESIPREKYEFEYSIGETVWNKAVPPKKVAMKFEDWLYKERKRLFDEQNSIEETDNTHQTNLKETAMSNETSYEFETFDRVLVRDSIDQEWNPDLFIRFVPEDEDGDKAEYPYITLTSKYRYCIPYNEEMTFTKATAKTSFKEGDAVEFLYLMRDKWFRGTLAEISTKEKKGDSYIYRVDFIDEDGDKDYLWCKLDQLREACVDTSSKKEEDAPVDYKFKEGEKVWYRGDYSNDQWTTGTVVAIDRNDPDLTYHIKLFINDMTWWVNENTLKKIDDNPL
jgi:hypothetical protein